MSRMVQVTLTGVGARPGEIAAADVARLITGLERALARAAYLVLGRPHQGSVGRHTAAVEAASRLRFVGTEAGSFVSLLALPDVPRVDDRALEVEVEDLSRGAFDRLVAFIAYPGETGDAQLAGVVARLADDLGIGERTDTLTVGEPEHDRPRAVVDLAVRRQMRQLSQRLPAHREDLVIGTLFEANFEKRTAALRVPGSSVPVTVTFGGEMADDIHQALRREAQMEGRVRYDQFSGVAVSIEIRTLTRADQLFIPGEGGNFDENLSVAELQRRQGIDGDVDLADLVADNMTDDERDAFVAALASF